ncbi:DUF3116 domain-containing protein, partial [Listeria monocytogenes]|nr:DUF3116 domain-containing protein [Listeria monocytogenes]EAG7450507.1 DUF3116 domain-containing protein [Listeria monocytogenes]
SMTKQGDFLLQKIKNELS